MKCPKCDKIRKIERIEEFPHVLVLRCDCGFHNQYYHECSIHGDCENTVIESLNGEKKMGKLYGYICQECKKLFLLYEIVKSDKLCCPHCHQEALIYRLNDIK